MEKLRRAAFLSIGRAVSFSAFAILTVMLGLSFEPVLALQTGGILLLILLVGLLLKAHRSHSADYRRSEAWLLLGKNDRPDERYAREVMGTALREACLWFARWTAGAAAIVWGMALVLNAFGADPGLAV
jgi:hypothetical protein